MKRASRDEYLDLALQALVAFFGIDAVKRGVTTIEGQGNALRPLLRSDKGPTRVLVPKGITELAASDSERFEILQPFFERIVARQLLRESGDIRRFAEHVRVKDLRGKSRRELVANLAAPLLAMPLKDLRAALKKAEGISEEERRQGYSVLTERLLRATHRPMYWCQPDVASNWLRATGWIISGARARRGRSSIPAPQPHGLYDLHEVAIEEGVRESEIVRRIVLWAGRPDVAGDSTHPPSSAQMESLTGEGAARHGGHTK